jgi:hypothetical protein
LVQAREVPEALLKFLKWMPSSSHLWISCRRPCPFWQVMILSSMRKPGSQFQEGNPPHCQTSGDRCRLGPYSKRVGAGSPPWRTDACREFSLYAFRESS